MYKFLFYVYVYCCHKTHNNGLIVFVLWLNLILFNPYLLKIIEIWLFFYVWWSSHGDREDLQGYIQGNKTSWGEEQEQGQRSKMVFKSHVDWQKESHPLLSFKNFSNICFMLICTNNKSPRGDMNTWKTNYFTYYYINHIFGWILQNILKAQQYDRQNQ